ncbi:hypothetical protein [Streptomyces anulatus]|uniref:hypothetical protein n=1 Tax=Streptomyces anulatus TaxID=1892 RepID=UPI0036DE186E
MSRSPRVLLVGQAAQQLLGGMPFPGADQRDGDLVAGVKDGGATRPEQAALFGEDRLQLAQGVAGAAERSRTQGGSSPGREHAGAV